MRWVLLILFFTTISFSKSYTVDQVFRNYESRETKSKAPTLIVDSTFPVALQKSTLISITAEAVSPFVFVKEAFPVITFDYFRRVAIQYCQYRDEDTVRFKIQSELYGGIAVGAGYWGEYPLIQIHLVGLKGRFPHYMEFGGGTTLVIGRGSSEVIGDILIGYRYQRGHFTAKAGIVTHIFYTPDVVNEPSFLLLPFPTVGIGFSF